MSTHEDPLSLIRNNIENQLLLKNLAGGAIWRAEGANHLLNLLVENMELIDQELEQR